jgi:hypothetical protein
LTGDGGPVEQIKPLPDADEQAMRKAVVSEVESDPRRYLAEYTQRFGNVLNADNAATLFAGYNENPAKYRVAVHPAAQWIRDELFRRSLADSSEGKDRVVFTAGGNAAGKSTAISFSGAGDHSTAAVLDSTLSNHEHANRLVEQATRAGKRVTILYVNRPLVEALTAMLQRAGTEGRVVTLDQLIQSQHGAAETVRVLWNKFSNNRDFAFRFFDNLPDGFKGGSVDLARPAAYTESRGALDEILDAEYRAGRIPEAIYRRVKGRGEPPVRGDRGGPDRGGNEPPA